MGSFGRIMAAVREAEQSNEVVSDETARVIASWYGSSAAIDAPVTALSHGLEFDSYALWERVSRMIDSDEFVCSGSTGTPKELRALKAWVVERMPRLVVVEYELDGAQWAQWMDQAGDSGREQPEGVEPIDTDVTLVAPVAHDTLADWVFPGDARYPNKASEHRGYDADDKSVSLPASDVEAAAAMLAGTYTGFYAEAYGANPFNPGMYWWQSDRFDEIGAGKAYASRYQRTSGDVQIKTATLAGFTPEQQAQVWKLWKGQP